MFGGGFGSTPSTFGAGGFGTATSTGATSVFGQPAQPQQTTSLFGGGTPAFGGQQPTLTAFGSGTSTGVSGTGAFGSQPNTSSVFGQQARPTTGIFSSTTNTISPFSTQTQTAGTSIPFNAITGTDTMMKNGAASQINTRHQCITCMKEYENKSLEELRLEDYQLNRKGPQAGMFGATPGATQPQAGTGLFSGIGGATANTAPGTSTFGQTSAFGQTAGTTGGGLFSSLSQPKPGGFFGGGTTTTSTSFGGGSGLGFSFNNPTSQPQTSIFGSNNNPATSNTGLGTSAFSFSSQPQQQQQQQGLSLFGQKTLQAPASTAPTFGGGFGATATNPTLNKPLFGGGTTSTFGAASTAPTFGTGSGSLFSTNTQQQQQNKPFTFSTPFSSTAQPSSQPAFGATSNTSTFSFSNPVSTPAVNFGSGTAPTFGGTGATTGTGSTFGNPLSFSLGSNTQPQQSTAGTGPTFGSGFFSSGTNNPGTGGTGTGLSLFGSNTGTSTLGTSFGAGTGLNLQNPQQLQMQQQQQQQQQQFMAQGTISFATTPFKDNQLFYNLISNRKVDDMTKPTNPLAQRQYREASRRKTSSVGPSSAISALNISSSPAVKTLTFPAGSKNNSITKFQIFDGFHDEDYGIGVDILSPKTNVKKLVLKNHDNSSSSPSLTPSNGTSEGGVGLARRASMLIGGTPPGKPSQSPLVNQRRSRLTMNSSLSSSFVGPDSTSVGLGIDANRTIDFGGDTSGGPAGEAQVPNNNSGNVSGQNDIGGGGDAFVNGGFSSKRGSEVDFGVGGSGGGSFVNGSASSPSSSGALAVDSNAGSVCGVTCSRPGYYVKPSLEELDKKVDANGNCIIKGFEVGRQNFGRIRFLEPVNVANINIDEIVLFRHKEVVVYPDDENKPDLGKGLNVPAEIELERVWPIDKSTNELVRVPEKIRSLNYEQKLRKACDRLGAEFVSYNDTNGLWKFNVAHFSKYSCDLEENEEEQQQPPAQQQQKGLGGIPQQKVQPPLRPTMTSPSAGTMPLGPSGDASTVGLRMPLPPHLTGMKSPIPPPLGAPMHVLESGSQPGSDVEVNPLTPCDSDDDDDDEDLDEEDVDEDMDDAVVISRRQPARPSELLTSPMMQKYKPILKDSGTDKSRMMKSVMSMEDFNVADPTAIIDSQPPIKKSRATTKMSLISDVTPEVEKEGMRLKERLQLPIGATSTPTQQPTLAPEPATTRLPPPAVVAKEPVDLSEEKLDDLFVKVGSREMTTAVKSQGCPRVCFLPNGHFLTLKQTVNKKGFNGQVKISQMNSYADWQDLAPLAVQIRSILEKQMQHRLEKDGVLFKYHINVLRSEIGDSSQVPQLTTLVQQELLIWELCDILWPGEDDRDEDFLHDDGVLLEQRKRLEEWLKSYAHILFGPEFDATDKSVLGLLKKGCIEDACNKAVADGNFCLAATLSCEPHLLLDFGVDTDVLQGMPPDTSDIFCLISGNLAKMNSLTAKKIRAMTTFQWLQYFALFLWFEAPVKSELPTPVDQAVREFEGLMRVIAEDDECPLPLTESSSVSNLAMHILKMYSCTGYPVGILVNPRTWTTDCLDYKLVWLLMRDFEEIGYLPGDDIYKGVCLGYSGMLESIGLWKWAIFVLKHLPGPECEAEGEEELVRKEGLAREVVCQRILERNISDQMSNEESFLVYSLNVDRDLIYSIKSWRSSLSSRKRVDETMWYLGSQGLWPKSFEVLKKYMASPQALDLIGGRVPALAKSMRQHLKRMSENKTKIVGWEVHGKMLENYLALEDSEGAEYAVLNFLESVIKFAPRNTNQCAFLLDMALSAQKVIQLLITEQEVVPDLKTKIEDSLVKFLGIPVPKEYFIGLSAFIDDKVGNETSPFNLLEDFRMDVMPPDIHENELIMS